MKKAERMKRVIGWLITSALILPMLFLNVSAKKSISVTIPVELEGNGTLVIEGNEHIPSNNALHLTESQGKGAFMLTFEDPDIGKAYFYEISQLPGEEENVVYDETAYTVGIYFSLDENDEVVPTVLIFEGDSETKLDSAKFKNTRTDNSKTVFISKTDITNSEELEGAEIVLLSDKDEVIEEWTSTKESHIVQVTPGTYKLREDVAPEGFYRITTTVEFDVNDDGEVQVLNAEEIDTKEGRVIVQGEQFNHLVLQDMPEKETVIDVYISKVDATNAKELPGAKMQLRNHEGKLIEEWTSTDTKHLVKLTVGDYVLHEEVAPEGYDFAQDIKFTIKDDGSVVCDSLVDGTIVMEDKPFKVEEPAPYEPEKPTPSSKPVETPEPKTFIQRVINTSAGNMTMLAGGLLVLSLGSITGIGWYEANKGRKKRKGGVK